MLCTGILISPNDKEAFRVALHGKAAFIPVGHGICKKKKTVRPSIPIKACNLFEISRSKEKKNSQKENKSDFKKRGRKKRKAKSFENVIRSNREDW